MASAVNPRGAFGDMALAGQTPAAVIGAVAFPIEALAGAPQMLMQVAPTRPAMPIVAVNRLVTDRQVLAPTQHPRYLLRAPLQAQQRRDLPPIDRRDMLNTAGPRATAIGALDGLAGSIVAVRPRAIAPDLASDGAAVAAWEARNLGLAIPLQAQRRKPISLACGELVVHHRDFPCLGGWENPQVFQRTSPRRMRVAPSEL